MANNHENNDFRKNGAAKTAVNPAGVYLARLASSSQAAQRQILAAVAAVAGSDDPMTFDWAALRAADTASIRAALVEKYAPATANRALSALRGVLRACWRLGLMSGDDYQAAADVGGVKFDPLPAGRALAAGELQDLMEVCGRTVLGRRDAAIIATLYATGMRRAELAALQLGDYDQAAQMLTIRKGKGGKGRAVPVAPSLAKYLASWLAWRGQGAGALFTHVDRRIAEKRPLTPAGIYAIVQRRAAAAKLDPVRPHDLRRTFVTNVLDAGADVITAQRLAGHAKPETTARYDRRGHEALRAAVDRLPPV